MPKNSSRNIEKRVTVTHNSRPLKGKNGMKHIIQPRGDGTAYQFKMRTPAALRGMKDPATGKNFGTYIKRTLGGTRHLPTAKKLRDIRLAEVRTMEADAIRGEATVKRYHYDSHAQLRSHLADFLAAYNFARRLKTLSGLTPYEYVCKIWTLEPERFILNPIHQMPGLNT